MGMAWDMKVIDEDVFKEMRKLEGQKLLEVKREYEGDDLILIFEKDTLKITAQDSENYGFNVFFNYDKTPKQKGVRR